MPEKLPYWQDHRRHTPLKRSVLTVSMREGRRVRTVLRAMRVRSTSARHRIRHGIRHTAVRAGRRPCPSVANDRLRHMLIGYARVSKADGSQSLDLQRAALRAAGNAKPRTTPKPTPTRSLKPSKRLWTRRSREPRCRHGRHVYIHVLELGLTAAGARMLSKRRQPAILITRGLAMWP